MIVKLIFYCESKLDWYTSCLFRVFAGTMGRIDSMVDDDRSKVVCAVRRHCEDAQRMLFHQYRNINKMRFYLLKRYLPWLLLMALLPVLDGCRYPLRFGSVDTATEPSAAMVKRYDVALDAYKKADYSTAAEHFDAIRLETTDKTMARRALYGLACSKLMAADTPEAYRMAISVWENWVASAPRRSDRENPLLMEPLIKEKMLFSNIPLAQNSAEPSEIDIDKDTVPRWLLIRSNQELEKTRTQLEEAEKSTQQSRRKINALEKEVQKLKRQIKALETIDQKIQKKKNAIPSAD